MRAWSLASPLSAAERNRACARPPVASLEREGEKSAHPGLGFLSDPHCTPLTKSGFAYHRPPAGIPPHTLEPILFALHGVKT